MTATRSLRIDETLVLEAARTAKIEHRSINKQVEYWAKLGKAIASKLSMADVFAVTQGLKKIKLELVNSVPVDPIAVFDQLETDRAKGFPDDSVTDAPFFFETSLSQPGFLDQVNTLTGERQTGKFENGEFKAT